MGVGAGPFPFFWRFAEVGIDRVPFDVMRDPIKRPVFLHRIGSKSVLINSTFTR